MRLGLLTAPFPRRSLAQVASWASDEGFEALPEDFGEAAVLDMRVKGLSAFNLPGKRKVRLPQKLNIVNSFRFVFNEYFGTHYPFVEERELSGARSAVPVRGNAREVTARLLRAARLGQNAISPPWEGVPPPALVELVSSD